MAISKTYHKIKEYLDDEEHDVFISYAGTEYKVTDIEDSTSWLEITSNDERFFLKPGNIEFRVSPSLKAKAESEDKELLHG